MIRYAKYKDSGVEWIGDIPEGWGVIKTKFLTKNLDGMRIPLNSEERSSKEGIYPYWGSNGILDYVNGYIFDGENVLIGEDGSPFFDKTKDVSFFISGPIWVNNHIHILKSLGNILPKFLSHSFNCVDYKEYISGSTRDKLTQGDLKRIPHCLPPLKEQEQIVAYLDEKTAHIDKLLDISKRKIGLLKEQRASIINQVITKGLNPNTKMKNSGIEWIGDIPEGWGVNKVGNNTYVKGRIGWKGLKSEDFLDEGPYLVTGTDFNKDGTINWANIYHVSNERYDEDPFIQLKDNDVLITKDGTIGKVVYVGNLLGKTCLNSGIFLTRPTNGQYISRYFFWVLNSNVFKVFVYFNSNGATIQHLYQNVFINFKFPLPPLKEQEQIVAYLDEKTSIIDKSISIEERRIGLLKEYRQSIISQVVTGKIKVTADE